MPSLIKHDVANRNEPSTCKNATDHIVTTSEDSKSLFSTSVPTDGERMQLLGTPGNSNINTSGLGLKFEASSVYQTPLNKSDFSSGQLDCPQQIGTLCGICSETYAGENHTPKVLDCGHSVCSDCLATLLNTHKTCPKCEAPLVKLLADYPTNFDLLSLSNCIRKNTCRDQHIICSLESMKRKLKLTRNNLVKSIEDRTTLKDGLNSDIDKIEEMLSQEEDCLLPKDAKMRMKKAQDNLTKTENVLNCCRITSVNPTFLKQDKNTTRFLRDLTDLRNCEPESACLENTEVSSTVTGCRATPSPQGLFGGETACQAFNQQQSVTATDIDEKCNRKDTVAHDTQQAKERKEIPKVQTEESSPITAVSEAAIVIQSNKKQLYQGNPLKSQHIIEERAEANIRQQMQSTSQFLKSESSSQQVRQAKISPQVPEAKVSKEVINNSTNSIQLIKLDPKEGQWSPENLNEKRQYDRDFLLEMRRSPLSLRRPNNLPSLEIVLNKMNSDCRASFHQNSNSKYRYAVGHNQHDGDNVGYTYARKKIVHLDNDYRERLMFWR